jgi:hypothetical protein
MEDVVNFLCFRKIKMICYVRDSSGYPKGSISPW